MQQYKHEICTHMNNCINIEATMTFHTSKCSEWNVDLKHIYIFLIYNNVNWQYDPSNSYVVSLALHLSWRHHRKNIKCVVRKRTNISIIWCVSAKVSS